MKGRNSILQSFFVSWTVIKILQLVQPVGLALQIVHFWAEDVSVKNKTILPSTIVKKKLMKFQFFCFQSLLYVCDSFSNSAFLKAIQSPRRGIGSSCRVGVTPLRRNYTSGLRWPRVPQPWMLFPAPLTQLHLQK